MNFSSKDFEFKGEAEHKEEKFLQKMGQKISEFHHHLDGTPIILHPEQKPRLFEEKDDFWTKKRKEEVLPQTDSLKNDYGTSGGEVSFGCGCGKKWEASFKSEVVEVNEVLLNLRNTPGYSPSSSSSSSSSSQYNASGSRKSTYSSSSSYNSSKGY